MFSFPVRSFHVERTLLHSVRRRTRDAISVFAYGGKRVVNVHLFHRAKSIKEIHQKFRGTSFFRRFFFFRQNALSREIRVDITKLNIGTFAEPSKNGNILFTDF